MLCAVLALLSDVALLDRAVATKDGRLTARVLRDINRIRKLLHPSAAGSGAPASPVPHLAALFAALHALHSSATPPLSLALVRDTLLSRDDTAAQAWTEAQHRVEAQSQKEETERKQRADRDSGSEQAGRSDAQAMQLHGDDTAQSPAAAQPHGAAQQPTGQPMSDCPHTPLRATHLRCSSF